MQNTPTITRPMGAADLTQAAEEAGKLALALSDLARGIAAYEAATGIAIAVVDCGSLRRDVMVTGNSIATSEVLAVEPAPAIAQTITRADLAPGPDETVTVMPTPKPKPKPEPKPTAVPTWPEKPIPDALLEAVQHIQEIGPSGPKWGFAQDLDMIDRAIDGQTEKFIADVMEFSASHIRQRFNKLVDRNTKHAARFTREMIFDALTWMLGDLDTDR